MTIGRHLFMAKYGPEHERTAHLAHAAQAIRDQTPKVDHDGMEIKDIIAKRNEDGSISYHPHHKQYTDIWRAINTGDHFVVDQASGSPNHVVRAMAARSAKMHYQNDKIDEHRAKELVNRFAMDPHEHVVSHALLMPGMVRDSTLNHVYKNPPSPRIKQDVLDIMSTRALHASYFDDDINFQR